MKSFLARLLPQRIFDAHSNHRRIAWSLFSVAGFVLTAKLISTIKEMAVAWRFGVSGEVDAYLLAFTISTWLPGILGFVLMIVAVPRLVALQKEPEESRRFIRELNGFGIIVGLVVVALSALLGPLVVGHIASDLPEAVRSLSQTLVIQLVPLSFLMTAVWFFNIRLQAKERPSFTLLESMPALGILLLIFIIPMDRGVAPLTFGVLFGALIQVLLLGIMTHKVDGEIGSVSFTQKSPEWRPLYAALSVMVVGQIIMGLLTPIDQVFAAQEGAGAIAALGYAYRVIALPIGLGATAILRALLPVLSTAAANGEFQLGRAQALKWSWFMLGLGALGSAIGWVLAPWGVRILFQRGAFTSEDTEVVAQVLRFGILQLPFYFSGVVLIQWLAIVREYRLLLSAAVLAVVSKIAFNYFLIEKYSVSGIAFATSITYLITWLSYEFFVRTRKV